MAKHRNEAPHNTHTPGRHTNIGAALGRVLGRNARLQPTPETVPTIPKDVTYLFDDLEKHDAAFQPVRTHNIGNGRSIVISGQPLASEQHIEELTGWKHTTLRAVINGTYRPVNPVRDLQADAKNEHIRSLNTLYLLEERAPGQPPRLLVTNRATVEDRHQAYVNRVSHHWQSEARRAITDSTPLRLGRDVKGGWWLPFVSARDYPADGALDYLTTADNCMSRRMAEVTYTPETGEIHIAEGPGGENWGTWGVHITEGSARHQAVEYVPAHARADATFAGAAH